MHLLEFANATAFLERSREHLIRFEAENNLLLSSAWILAKGAAPRSTRLGFYVIEDRGQVRAAALLTSERGLLISVADPEATKFIGEELASREPSLKSVMGPNTAATDFCLGFQKRTGTQFRVSLQQKVLRLESSELCEHTPVTGLLRIAKDKDFKLLLSWTHQFVRECHLPENASENEEMVRRYIDNRQLFVWEDPRPVAMAGFGGITPNGVRVNMVYTDPAHRSRGYAASLVHILSRRLLSAGHKYCYLFTDAANPVSNRIYERLGYRTVCDFLEYKLHTTQPG